MAKDLYSLVVQEELVKQLELTVLNAEQCAPSDPAGQKQYLENAKEIVDILENAKRTKTQKFFEGLKVAATFLGIILPVGLYAVLFCLGIKFEESGAFTSKIFQDLLKRIGRQ